jgi:hypothetical protein
VQEASSMLVAHAARQLCQAPVSALDLCAAPGGKNTQLADALPDHSVIVANETIASRTTILAENVTKWGNPNTLVVRNDARDFARVPPIFDLLLADVPCSGEGMFRKDKQAQALWSTEAVKLCAARQRRIVADAWTALKEGGFLIYSTCTFNMHENEENVAWFVDTLGAECVKIAFDPQWNITPTDALNVGNHAYIVGYHCFPHKVKGEGFFMAVLQKTAAARQSNATSRFDICNSSRNHNHSNARSSRRHNDNIRSEIKNYLLRPDEFIFEQRGDGIYATTAEMRSVEFLLEKHLHTAASLNHIATIKGGKAVPTIQLALSANINAAAFVVRELLRDEALAYLRRDAIKCRDVIKCGDAIKCGDVIKYGDVARNVSTGGGLELVTHAALPLGFINNTGGRCNNLFPVAWRVKT